MWLYLSMSTQDDNTPNIWSSNHYNNCQGNKYTNNNKKNLAYKWAIKISGNSSLRLRRDGERLSNCLTLTRAA